MSRKTRLQLQGNQKIKLLKKNFIEKNRVSGVCEAGSFPLRRIDLWQKEALARGFVPNISIFSLEVFLLAAGFFLFELFFNSAAGLAVEFQPCGDFESKAKYSGCLHQFQKIQCEFNEIPEGLLTEFDICKLHDQLPIELSWSRRGVFRSNFYADVQCSGVFQIPIDELANWKARNPILQWQELNCNGSVSEGRVVYAPWSDVDFLMDDLMARVRRGPCGKPRALWAQQITNEFLHIHPFVDGNGRVSRALYRHLSRARISPCPVGPTTSNLAGCADNIASFANDITKGGPISTAIILGFYTMRELACEDLKVGFDVVGSGCQDLCEGGSSAQNMLSGWCNYRDQVSSAQSAYIADYQNFSEALGAYGIMDRRARACRDALEAGNPKSYQEAMIRELNRGRMPRRGFFDPLYPEPPGSPGGDRDPLLWSP